VKKLICAAAIGAAMTFSGAVLANDTMDAAYSNTIVVTLADGTALNYLFNADGSYSFTAGDTTGDGAFTLGNGEICLTPTGGDEGCTPLTDGMGVGDSWEGTSAADGSPITVTITAGR